MNNGPLKWLFRVQYPYLDPLSAQRARGLLTICIGVGLAALLGAIYDLTTLNPGSSFSAYLTLATISSGVVLCALTLALVQRGQLAAGSSVMVFGLQIIAAAFLLPYGLNHVGVVILIIPLVFAGALFNRRGVAYTILSLIVLASAISILNNTGAIQTRPFLGREELAVGGLLAMTLFLSAIGAILWVFTGAQTTLLQRTSRSLRELRALAEISRELTRPTRLEELLIRVVEAIRDHLGYYNVQVFLVEESSRLIVRRARTGSGGTRSLEDRRIQPEDTQNIVAQVVRSRLPIQVGFSSPVSHRTEFLSATQAELLLPLIQGEQVLGVLDVQSAYQNAFGENEIGVLETVAAQLTISLQALRAAHELETTNAERRRLQEQTIRLVQDVERLSQEATGRAYQRYLATRSQDVIGFDWEKGQLTANAKLTPAQREAFHETGAAVRHEGSEDVLSVPIQLRGQTLGLIEFGTAAERPWDRRNIELARLITQRLALAIDNTRLFEQAQLNISREQTINQVVARLQTKTELDSLLAVAAEAFSEALGATRTSIQLGLPERPAEPQAQSQPNSARLPEEASS